MTNLDSLEEIQTLDKGNILGSIEAIPSQIEDAWRKVTEESVPDSCKLSRNVVICGMGGSALGGRIADSLLTEKAKVPIEIFTEFRLPNYVDRNTLVILTSYSGNTQETLSCANEALNRGASIFGISTGGKLSQWLRENDLNSFIFEPKFNPSNQPRMALGYMITSTLAVLAQCGFVNLVDSEIAEAARAAKEAVTKFGIQASGNPAKEMARFFQGKIPIMVASEHLLGTVHAFKNQLNENAKTFSCIFDIPELNHHLLEGLGNPKSLISSLGFVFFESDYYSRDVQSRYSLTEEVVLRQGAPVIIYKVQGVRKLPQIFEVLILGSYAAFYLAMLYGVDPTPIPWVDYFKSKLV